MTRHHLSRGLGVGLPLAVLLLTQLQPATAAAKLPFPDGTYAAKRAYCAIDRLSDRNPEFGMVMAYIDLAGAKLYFNEAEGEIRKIETRGEHITLFVIIDEEGVRSREALRLQRLSPTSFELRGNAYVYCGRKLPNPYFDER